MFKCGLLLGLRLLQYAFLLFVALLYARLCGFVKGFFEKISINPHAKCKKSCKHSINHIKINIKQQKARVVNSNDMYIECGLMLLCDVGFIVW